MEQADKIHYNKKEQFSEEFPNLYPVPDDRLTIMDTPRKQTDF
ncbi:hypothetical protein [Ileibacterium valens]|nr:hypothetical protein [Ileibacterium valens]